MANISQLEVLLEDFFVYELTYKEMSQKHGRSVSDIAHQLRSSVDAYSLDCFRRRADGMEIQDIADAMGMSPWMVGFFFNRQCEKELADPQLPKYYYPKADVQGESGA